MERKEGKVKGKPWRWRDKRCGSGEKRWREKRGKWRERESRGTRGTRGVDLEGKNLGVEEKRWSRGEVRGNR